MLTAAAEMVPVVPLVSFLPLEDMFSLVLGSQSCRRLCSSSLATLNLQALGANQGYVLERLAQSSLTASGQTIRDINAAFCNEVSTATLQALPKLPLLERINLDYCQNIDDDSLLALAQRCSGLRSISLYWNAKVSDKGLCRILRAQNGKELRYLNFSGCKNLSDETVQRIVSKAPHAEHLDLTRCPEVTEVGVALICECLEKLRVLRLFAMGQVSSKGFNSIHKLLFLEELDLCGCKVEDDPLVRMLDSCAPSRLKVLNLTWCAALTDASMLAITRACPNLGWLSVFGNVNISSSAIDALAASPCGVHGKLHSLDIRGLTKATDYSLDIARLRVLFPSLVRWELHY